MERQAEPRPVVTESDRSPIIQAITWLLLATMFLSLSFRLLTRFFLLRRFRWDDLLIVISFVFGIAQSATLLVPESIIWGESLQELAPGSLDPGLRAQYAGQLISILSLCFAKLSVPIGLLSISPVELHRRAIFALGTVIIAWTITSEFSLAFKCGVPEPWNYVSRSCLDRQSLALYIGIINILTDIGLIVLPIYIIAPLRMPVNKRLTIIALFSARITVIAATITQLSYLRTSFRSDFTFSSFPYIICTQVAQALSITTACIPYLQPFLESLKTGLLWTEDIQRQGQMSVGVSSYTNAGSTGNRRDYLEIEEGSVNGKVVSETELKTLRDKYESAGIRREERAV